MILRLLGLVMLAALAGACGGGDDDDGDPFGAPPGTTGTPGQSSGNSNDPCKPHCDGADDRSSFQSGSYQSVTCVWYCKNGKYISETYENRNGCYGLESRYVSDPICD